MRKQSGQTLIIAILVLGVLLIIGFAFASLVSRNIEEAGRARTRTVASDLAQAGLSFAHYQLANSSQGADWRPEATAPSSIDAGGLSRDPDSLYLRQGSGLSVAPDPANPTFTLVDRGGPDYKGPFSRTFTERGRRLIRVRYAPNDLTGLTTGRDSALRQPGKAKNLVIIESVGRTGALTSQGRLDPTRQLKQAVQVANFTTGDQVASAVGAAKAAEHSVTGETRKMVGFASLGLIEHALFITNKNRTSRPAEIGFPVGVPTDPLAEGSGVGATYPTSSGPVAVETPTLMGQTYPEPNLARSTGFQNIPGGGGLYSNADLLVYGSVRAAVNTFLGEGWTVNGRIRTANRSSQLQLSRVTYDKANDRWVSGMQGHNADGTTYSIASTVATPFVLNANRIESDDPGYSTALGVVRDSVEGTDTENFPRGATRKEPPSMLSVDPQTKRNRYYELTRNSGRLLANNRRAGVMGYGEGVYVDASERGNLDSEDERRQEGAVRSLPSDWLNPGSSSSLGWQGPYYIPVAPHVQLLPDGFEITRDSRSRSPYWRNPDGSAGSSSRCRFRLRTIGLKTYILNSIQSPSLASAPSGSISDSDFINGGEEFNGVVFFEGDVRVRGVIPTDIQINLVSMGSIYIEGSITKGNVVGDSVIGRPSRSILMLMARDYAVVNTTMFFGPMAGQTVAVKAGQPVAETPSPIEFDPSDAASVILNTEFLSGPEVSGGNAASPSTWRSYANSYEDTTNGLSPRLVLSASADDNGPSFLASQSAPISFGDAASAAFSTLNVPRLLDFGTAGTVEYNAASQWIPGVDPIEIYGLGDPAINAYPKFEAIGFPLLGSGASETARRLSSGNQTLALNDPTLFRLRLQPIGSAATKNFLLARAAVIPHDVKIEASLFAEEGSFFVIPGNWFNTNPDDTRQRYMNDVSSIGDDRARLHRYQLYGSAPIVPFYGEPMDVRVRIIGSIAENMPAPMSQQSQWLQKWGWIPGALGATGRTIPRTHFGSLSTASNYVPNFSLTYDATLALGTADGVNPVRTHPDGWVLPPVPRLPVSPTLAYFGDANP